jgi:hypothetical protein
VGGQQHPGPGVEDGLVGEVHHLVGGETLQPGQEGGQRSLAVHVAVDADVRRLERRAQLLGAAQEGGADHRPATGAQLLDGGPDDRWIVLAVDEHERAPRRRRRGKRDGRGRNLAERAAPGRGAERNSESTGA